jgi:myosin protein heavy chain
MNRLETVMREMKSKEERLTTMTTASAEYETMLKRKDADIADIRAELNATRAQLDDLKRKFRDADMLAETAKKDLQSSNDRNDKLAGNMTRVQQELDGLRKLMSAKQSEDAQRKEADRSREQELLSLRAQLDKAAQQERTLREDHNKASEGHKKELKNAQDQVAKQIALVSDLTAQLTAARDQLEKQTSLLSTTAKVTRGLEVDLAECRKRLITRDGELDVVVKAKEVS